MYQDNLTPSLASNPRPGHLAHNCKMGYSMQFANESYVEIRSCI